MAHGVAMHLDSKHYNEKQLYEKEEERESERKKAHSVIYKVDTMHKCLL